MRRTILGIVFIISSAFAPACTCIARGPEDYRADTRNLLETRNSEVKKCYDAELRKNHNLNGDVVVHFTVEKKSGKIINVAVDEQTSKAPKELETCIANAVDGLVLEPPDRREGDATFTWRFRANSRPAA